MLNLDEVNAAITEAGPLDAEILAVLRVADDRWVIEFEPLQIDLECDAATGRLMFSGVIGPVPEHRKLETLEMLLSYALLWRETNGIRMGMSGTGGDVVQMADLAEAEIEPRLIATVASNLAERTLLWRAMINADVPMEMPPHENNFDSIRV